MAPSDERPDLRPEPGSDLPLDATDASVLAVLRDVFEENDPVPADLAERSKFAMTVAALEAEVASIVAADALAGLRSTDYNRASTVTFASDNLSAMVSIENGRGSRCRISGWVTDVRVEVELRERSRTRVTRTDSEGRFVFESVERGLVHFVLRSLDDPGAQPVITPAIEV